jgi:sugar phosphate isomerase/epimerase
VSRTYTLAHPNPDVRSAGLRRVGVLIAAAPALGTGIVTLCTGSRDPTDMWRRHPDNASRAAWRDMRASVEAALQIAQDHDVTLAFEPEHNNVVDSAAAGRRLLDEMHSPHLRVVFDAANLVTGPDLEHQGHTMRQAFELLGDSIVLAHAKDIRADGTVVAAGRCGLDYGLYAALLAQVAGDVPLIMHGLADSEVPDSLAFLRVVLARTPTA